MLLTPPVTECLGSRDYALCDFGVIPPSYLHPSSSFMTMSPLQELHPPSSDTMPRLSPSPSFSNTSSSSDDAPQLSFEYRWDDEGNYVRLSKKPSAGSNPVDDVLESLDDINGGPPDGGHSLLNEILGNERTAENPQSIAVVLSRSHSVTTAHEQLSSAASLPSRPFKRVVSGPDVSTRGHKSSLLSSATIERPLGRARRVPIDAKRREDFEFARREEEEREHALLRIREHEKENWANVLNYSKGEHTNLHAS